MPRRSPSDGSNVALAGSLSVDSDGLGDNQAWSNSVRARRLRCLLSGVGHHQRLSQKTVLCERFESSPEALLVAVAATGLEKLDLADFADVDEGSELTGCQITGAAELHQLPLGDRVDVAAPQLDDHCLLLQQIHIVGHVPRITVGPPVGTGHPVCHEVIQQRVDIVTFSLETPSYPSLVGASTFSSVRSR